MNTQSREMAVCIVMQPRNPIQNLNESGPFICVIMPVWSELRRCEGLLISNDFATECLFGHLLLVSCNLKIHYMSIFYSSFCT